MYVFVVLYEKLSLNYMQYPLLSGALTEISQDPKNASFMVVQIRRV